MSRKIKTELTILLLTLSWSKCTFSGRKFCAKSKDALYFSLAGRVFLFLFFRSKCVNMEKNIETYFGTPCIRGLPNNREIFFFIFSEFTLSSVQTNVTFFQFPVASKQLAVH